MLLIRLKYYILTNNKEYTSIDKLRLFPRCLVNKKRFLLK